MSYATSSTVVAFKSAKQAALYCEHVVPLEIAELIPVRDSGEPGTFEILQKVLPPSLVDPTAPRSVHKGIIEYLSVYLVAFPQAMGIDSLPTGETLEQRAQRFLPQLYSNMSSVLVSVAEPINGVLDLDPLGNASNATMDVSMQLAGLNLIDVERLTWKHLLEFREDKESLKKLQHLRLFFQEKFDGKSKEYVKDSLLVAIDKHDETVKRWGFETVTGTLESIFSSKLLAALGIGSLTLALGAPIAVGVGVVVALEVGTASIKIANKRRSLTEFRKFDPVSYLIEVRDVAKADSAKAN